MEGLRLTLTLLVLGAVVLAATMVLRGFSWKELGIYGDAPDYLVQARTFRPGLSHMPLYGWTIGALHLLMFRVPPIEAMGVAVSFASLILTAHAVRAILQLDRLTPRRAFWIALALSLFPARHFVYATRILADNMALLFATLGYLCLRREQGHRANLCLCCAALTHDLSAILWIPTAMEHTRRRAWGPLMTSPVIFLPSLALILARIFPLDGVSRFQYAGRPNFTLPLFGLLRPPFEQPWLNAGIYASFAVYSILYGWAFYRCKARGPREALWFSVAPFLVLLCLREYVLYYAFDRFLAFSFPVLLSILSGVDFKRFRARAALVLYALLTLMSAVYFVWSFPSSDIRERLQRSAPVSGSWPEPVGNTQNNLFVVSSASIDRFR